MRINKGRRGIEEGDMTPMIDMVFQLIAFFMVLVNFTEQETNQDVVLPHSVLAKAPDPPLKNVVFVHMTEDAEVILLGQRIILDNAYDYLYQEAQIIRNSNVSVDDTTVVIRAHEDANTGHVQKLISECLRAGFKQFALRATSGEENHS